jgi:hypothetical protein
LKTSVRWRTPGGRFPAGRSQAVLIFINRMCASARSIAGKPSRSCHKDGVCATDAIGIALAFLPHERCPARQFPGGKSVA